jgi:GTP-binding protein
LVGEERAIVSDLAGTTRDIVEARFHYRGVDFEVVDTAGLRRRSRVDDGVEFYSVQRANDAIDSAELVVLVIDALNGLSDQDKKIAARLSERGCGIVVALNKWDLLDDRGNQINAIRDRVHFLFPVFQHVPILPISAKTGEGVQPLLNRLLHVRRELYRRVDTGPLNQALQTWLQQTPPPSGKRPVKLRYITQVGTNPVRFLLFVNRRKGFPEFYLRYVRNRIRKDLGFEHIPFFIDLKE